MPQFEWDSNKAAENKAKHGITFVEAQELWADVRALTIAVDSLEHGEPRWFKIGKAKGKVWRAVYTMRGEKVRLISCHLAKKKFKEAYESDQ